MYDTDIFERYTSSEHGLQSNRIPLRIIRRQHSLLSPVSLHSHNFWEIIVVLSGSGRHVVYQPSGDELVYPISKGNVCIVAPGEKHAFGFEPQEEIEIINLLFSSLVIQRGETSNWDDMSASDFLHAYSYIPAIKRQQLQISLSPDKFQVVYSLIQRIESEMHDKELGYNTFVQLYFTIVLTYFMREYYSQADTLFDNAKDSACVQKALQYIDQNSAHLITLEQVAEYTHFSVRHLTRKFREVMGVSISEYIHQQRMENAKVLLLSTNRRVEDIALENGFNTVSYFCQQFKKYTGQTPQQFRRAGVDAF